MKQINCTICGALFKPISYNAKYCSDECRKEGKKLINHEWDKNNREYNKQRLKKYRQGQKLIKEQKHIEHREAIKRKIEEQTGGKFIDD